MNAPGQDTAQPGELPTPVQQPMALSQVAQLQAELAHARAELEDFTYSVSHDLRASLRHVTSYVQIIQEDLEESVNADIGAHLDTVNQAARQMGRQIDGLMALSRLTAVDLQWTPLDMAALVREVLAELTPALRGRVMEWQLAPGFPVLRGDATLVREALTHLLGNACKFTAAQPQGCISVTWQPQRDGRCAVTVGDNGAGFNPAYKSKLFRAFQRLHSAREFEGLGMGLALTRKIMERHGGTVWADGVVNGGCQVSFTLPLAAAPVPQTCCV